MKKIGFIIALTVIFCFAVLGLSGSAYATLIDNGDGTVTQIRDHETYGDGSVLMWLKDASYAKTSGYDSDGWMRWNEAQDWIASLNSANHLGYDDWRLPNTLPVNGTTYDYNKSYDGSTDMGYNIKSPNSDMAYMYYVELGNLGYCDTSGNYQSGLNTGPFDNLQPVDYWSVREGEALWVFCFGRGYQGGSDLISDGYAWAVRNGDVGHTPVPEADAQARPLPDTGQTQSYTDTFGEDSDYTINPQSYTKLDAQGNDLPDSASSWVMVKDNVTGLIWEVKTNDESIHDKDNIYNWQDAQDVFIASLNAANFGGSSEWRLPTVKELSLLVNCGRYSPAIDTTYFPKTVSSNYWSFTTNTYSADLAWFVGFDDGNVHLSFKSYSHYVRAVRGEQSGSFNDLEISDGMVTDTTTGLMWQQATAGPMTWEAAISYCEGLDLGGHSDWRLPNRNELQSLLDYAKYFPAIDTAAFPESMSFNFWSSTTYDNNADHAWGVGIDVGYVYNDAKSYSSYVRAVRESPEVTVTIIHVPADYSTIQAAIDIAPSGATVLVADGIYMGVGNKDLDFRGNVITVESENGPSNCIIDCEGSGRGFNFHSGEGKDSILKGFTVQNGSASQGGGIYCYSSSPTISNCTISSNSAELDGGGIFCLQSSLWIVNCIISKNSAGYGALSGGGICCADFTSPVIINCTITGNSASNGGGAIMAWIDSFSTVINCIIYDNSPNEIAECGGIVEVTNSNILGGYIGEGNINVDPLFVDPIAGDYHLQPGSRCIDNGTNIGAPAEDNDGIQRPQDGNNDGEAICDIGAYEYFIQINLPNIALSPASLDFGSVNVGASFDLTVTVTNTCAADLVIGAVSMPLAPFSLITDNCSGQILGTSETCTIIIKFAPTDGLTYTGNFDISSNDPDTPHLSIPLTGNGVCVTQIYKDLDDDGYSDGITLISCSIPTGYKLSDELIAASGDCNDNDAAVHPGAAEVCDGMDNNCNGNVDEGFDLDTDGYTTCAGDCDDNDDTVYPGAPGTYRGKDNNCNGIMDQDEKRRSIYPLYTPILPSQSQYQQLWRQSFLPLYIEQQKRIWYVYQFSFYQQQLSKSIYPINQFLFSIIQPYLYHASPLF